MEGYIFNFILGGILTLILFHYSKKNDTIMSSIIVSVPIFFILGYIFLCNNNSNNNNNVNKYITNTMISWTASVTYLILIYIILIFLEFKIVSLIIATILYLLTMYLLIILEVIT